MGGASQNADCGVSVSSPSITACTPSTQLDATITRVVTSSSSEATVCKTVVQDNQEKSLRQLRENSLKSRRWIPSAPRLWWNSTTTLRIWWYEIFCCVLSIGSVLAIVGTILRYQGRPLPQWRYGLSLNTLVSVYTAILKTAGALVLTEGLSHVKWTSMKDRQPLNHLEIYDEASRGPLGSLHLLRHLGLKRRVASVGAIATILLLPLDPIAQQLIEFYDCPQEVTSAAVAETPRVQLYSEPENNPALLATFHQALFSYEKIHVPWHCASGNCSFVEYHSIALCSACTDETPNLSVDEVRLEKNLELGLTRASLYYNTTLNVTGSSESTYRANFMTEVGKAFRIVQGNFTELLMIRYSSGNHRAYSCILKPCIQTYRSHVVKNIFDETLLSEHQPEVLGNGHGVLDLRCVSENTQGKGPPILRNLGYQFNESTRWLSTNLSYAFNMNNLSKLSIHPIDYELLDPKARSYYRVSDSIDKWYTLTEDALQAFPLACYYELEQWSLKFFLHQTWSKMNIQGTLADVNGNLAVDEGGSEVILTIFRAGSGNLTLQDLQAKWNNLSIALTAYMRIHSNRTLNQPAQGLTYQNTACIRIQWSWIAYIVVTVALLLIFFVPTLIGSRRSQFDLAKQWSKQNCNDREDHVNIDTALVHDFKSSILPMAFLGLENTSRDRLLDMVCCTNRTAELRDVAKGVEVILAATGQGWRLKLVEKQC